MDTLSALATAIISNDGPSMSLILSGCANYRNVSKLQTNILSSDFNISQDIKSILEDFIKLNKAIDSHEIVDCFFKTNDLLRTLNRFAETNSNWILKPLIAITKDLIRTAIKADDYLEDHPNMKYGPDGLIDSSGSSKIGDLEMEACLIKAARTIHNSFKLCLNDRNENTSLSRRNSVYFFVGQELKIYFKLQNRELAKNMEKVLSFKQNELPSLYKIEKSQAITYLYYSGAILCGDGDFENAYLKFKKAYQLCAKFDFRHCETILLYLIPLKFLVTKKYIDLNRLSKMGKSIGFVYSNIIISLNNGDLKLFDQVFDKLENIFLKKGLYIVLENLRNFVLVKLIKKIHRFNGTTNPHLPLKLINRGIEFSKFHTNNKELMFKHLSRFSMDETECLLANLIFKGYIKGYISHTNGVLVLSRKEPFPNQVHNINDELA